MTECVRKFVAGGISESLIKAIVIGSVVFVSGLSWKNNQDIGAIRTDVAVIRQRLNMTAEAPPDGPPLARRNP